jgi:predicted transcriptional regulator
VTTSLIYNSFHVLGLDGTATVKRAIQRANEITQRLKIDDSPAYFMDLLQPDAFRSEQSVKEALRLLQSPKTRLREYFFWFRIDDQIDKDAAAYIAKGDYNGAIDTWRSAARSDSPTSQVYKRNLSIALFAVIASSDELRTSLAAWKAILESKKFWTAFGQEYLQTGETISDDALIEFKNEVSGFLSDIYAEIQEAQGASDYLYEFRQFFDAKGEKVGKDILEPVYRSVETSIEALQKILIKEDDQFSGNLGSQIKVAISAIQSELNKLIEAGFYDDSQSIILRDRAAKAIRSLALPIHNQLNEKEVSAKLFSVAAEIAGTNSQKALLSSEHKQVQENIASDHNNTLKIEVPGTFGGGTMIFKDDKVIYNGRTLMYKDADVISYQAVGRSVNLVPISQSYSYRIGAKGETIDISFGTSLYIGNKKKQDVWAQLIHVSKHLIEPTIVQKLLRSVFEDGRIVKIGGLEITREGYSRGKLFGGREYVSWQDVIYIPKLSSGNVIVWKDKGGKGVVFDTISMSIPNAVILPELLPAAKQAGLNARG